MNPIDIIANAIRIADGQHTMGAAQLADVVAENLTADRILDAAVQALKDDGWEETPEGPMGVYQMSDDDLRNIARTVLAVFGGGR